VLGEHGIFNCIIRVPITFPPEKLRGVQLSAIACRSPRHARDVLALHDKRRTITRRRAAKCTSSPGNGNTLQQS